MGEPIDNTELPAATAFVAAADGAEYFWVGSRAWQDIPEADRVYFRSEEEARSAGYRRSRFTFEDLDEFEILGEIGQGGTSVVYRARDRALGRDVAIKVIHSTFGSDPETVARFTQEARLLAGLRHPGIVSAFAVKRMQGGGLALVMEYVAGRTLRDVLREEGSLPAERVERILRDIAEALIAAHDHGIVHRDVKPDNIFLEENTGRALLADFGIAMNLENPSGLTIAGTAVGTPNYMSPEQIDGEGIDARSDLYSLGLIGWEMLAGERPWNGESLYSVIYKQKREMLPSLRTRRPDAPRRLLFALEGALAKRPDERWDSVEEFLVKLSDESFAARWRQWSSARLWSRRVAARLTTAGARVEASARDTQKTVVFRRSADGAARSRPAAAADLERQEPRRTWLRWAALIVVLIGGAAAATIATREPLAVSGSTATVPNSGAELARASNPERQGDHLMATMDPIVVPPPPDHIVTAFRAEPDEGGDVADPIADGGQDDDIIAEPEEEAVADVGSTTVVVLETPDSEAAPEPVATPAEEPRVEEAPFRLPVARGDSRIATGGMHTCAIDTRGTVHCWGGNDRGQLGSTAGERVERPRRIEAVSGFESIVAGGFHSCALSSEGVALCWGDNRYGQLGATDAEYSPPIRVTENRFYSLALGSTHSCGIGRDGRVYCWGSNASGQLGDGTRTTRTSPVAARIDGEIASIATGWSHSCALTQSGQLYCWGRNDRGQLGDGSTSDRPLPVLVADGHRFRAVTAGSAHTCALSVDGETFCWGENTDGRIGDGGSTNRSTPTRVVTSQRFVEISAGGRHTCGRTSGGTAYCWGQNNYGQLGTGTTLEQWTPTRVETATRFTSVRSSGSHTCGTGADGSTYCWGYNIEGQVGDGTRSHRMTPQRVEQLASGAV